MKTDSNGGPAFPAQHSIDGNSVKDPILEYTGMTLRDYFASRAEVSPDGLSREQSKAIYTPMPDGMAQEWDPGVWVRWRAAATARLRYIQADAMLLERLASAPTYS